MQKVPVAMATQHADSATKLVPVRDEVDEAVLSFEQEGLDCDEYLVDYMGKLTPYHQIGQIIQRIREKTKFVPGVDVFVTPRMVSSFEEDPFRQLMTTSCDYRRHKVLCGQLWATGNNGGHSSSGYDNRGVEKLQNKM